MTSSAELGTLASKGASPCGSGQQRRGTLSGPVNGPRRGCQSAEECRASPVGIPRTSGGSRETAAESAGLPHCIQALFDCLLPPPTNQTRSQRCCGFACWNFCAVEPGARHGQGGQQSGQPSSPVSSAQPIQTVLRCFKAQFQDRDPGPQLARGKSTCQQAACCSSLAQSPAPASR